MSELIIREPKISDEDAFITAMHCSKNLHSPWVKSPGKPSTNKWHL